VVAWNLPGSTTVKASVGFGLTDRSYNNLVRFGVSHEIGNVGGQIRKLFRRN
jgi:hypothetical protein